MEIQEVLSSKCKSPRKISNCIFVMPYAKCRDDRSWWNSVCSRGIPISNLTQLPSIILLGVKWSNPLGSPATLALEINEHHYHRKSQLNTIPEVAHSECIYFQFGASAYFILLDSHLCKKSIILDRLTAPKQLHCTTGTNIEPRTIFPYTWLKILHTQKCFKVTSARSTFYVM
jgi:hypothetical protein